MKKWHIICLLCAVLLCFTGCRDYQELDLNGMESVTDKDVLIPTEFSYRAAQNRPISHSMNRYSMVGDAVYYVHGANIMTYDPATGKSAYLCPDPFCAHDSNCEFFVSGMPMNVYAADGKLFFWQAGEDGGDVMTMYDTKTAKMTPLYSRAAAPVMVPSLLYSAPYLYHYTVVAEESEAFTVGDIVLNRYHTETGENTALLSLSYDGSGYLVGMAGERLIMTVGGQQIEAVTLSEGGATREVLVASDALGGMTLSGQPAILPDGTMIFSTTDKSDAAAVTTHFWSCTVGDGTLRALGEVEGRVLQGAICYTETALYFRLEKSFTLGTLIADNPANSGEITLYYPNFYSLEYATGKVESVYERLPEEYVTCELNREFFVCGDYIYLPYGHYGEVQADGIYTEAEMTLGLSGFMRIDMSDGALCYVGGS
ncbi:MAG: hypothetical protein IJW40_07310 [Clostridia bacterium]|nr:hypothetical protein [Clostridia bacterium]